MPLLLQTLLTKHLLFTTIRKEDKKDGEKMSAMINKTVLITGASRGIGAATALRFAARGYRVAVNYNHSEQKALSLVDQIRQSGADALAIRADVSAAADVERMFDECRRQLGGVNILVNNAGIAQQKLFTELTPEEWDRMFDINVKGVYLCCRTALPEMIRRKSGKIVNISSIWGLTGASCEVHYSAAKAAVIGLTKALAKEVGPSNIQVNCVAPGVVETDMLASFSPEDKAALKEETPLMRLGTPEDIAAAICFLASPEADFITGQVLSPNGGFVI